MSKSAKLRAAKTIKRLPKRVTSKAASAKLNLAAQLIRGKTAQKALVDLEFSTAALREVKKVLEAASETLKTIIALMWICWIVREATVGVTPW